MKIKKIVSNFENQFFNPLIQNKNKLIQIMINY